MELFFSSILGTIFYTAVVFIAGGFAGRPLYDWISPKLPWNKKCRTRPPALNEHRAARRCGPCH